MFHAEMEPSEESSAERENDRLGHHPAKTLQQSHPKKSRQKPSHSDHYSEFLNSRPQSLETFAIENILHLAHLAPSLNLHIVHLSASNAIPIIRSARQKGINITAETCFHYLTLSAETIQDGATQYKCCPPIREANNNDLLWKALFENDIGTVVSDHSPCTPDLKRLTHGDFMEAWGGIATIGLGLSVLWTEGRKRAVNFQDLVRWMCVGTAKQVGLYGRKGVIRVGADADLCIWSPDQSFRVNMFLIYL
jgi:allantoinase